MKRKMIICGNYGAGNLGDEAVLRGIINEFKGEFELTVMSANPTQTHQEFGVHTIKHIPSGIRSWTRSVFSKDGQKEWKATQQAIDRCDVFLLGGGTLLTDTPWQSIIIWAKQVEAALEKGKELWIHGSGIGPLRGDFARKQAKKILQKATRVSVRDHRSLQEARDLKCTIATLINDPVFNVKWNPENPQKRENQVIIVPREWSQNQEQTINAFAETVLHLSQKGKKIIGIPFDTSNTKDEELLEKIFEKSGVKENTKIWKEYHNEQDIMKLMSQSECVIGMRLHSLILAEITKTPFIGISYMKKVESLGENLGKKNQILDIRTLNSRQLIYTYNSLPKVLA